MKFRLSIPKIEEVTLIFYLTYMMWKYLLFSKLHGGWAISTALLIGLIFASYFKNRNTISQYLDVLFLYMVLFLLFFLKFVGNAEMKPWILRDYGLITVISWGGIYGYAVIRIQRNLNSIVKCLKIVGIILLLYYGWQSNEVLRNGFWTYKQFGKVRVSASNMSWSYGVLSTICYLSLFYFDNKKKLSLVFVVLGLIGILLYGSRGTVIAFVIGFVFVMLFYHDKKMSARNYALLALFVLLTIYIMSDAGISQVSAFLNSFGLNSRFVDTILHYTSFEDSSSGRFTIWIPVINMIRNGPFYGYGVYGERNVVYSTGLKWGYSHNIILELLVDFGWLFGTFIILGLIISIVRFFANSNDRNEKLIFIIFFTTSLELLLSNTIWLHSGFWIMIGLLRNHFSTKNARNKEQCPQFSPIVYR